MAAGHAPDTIGFDNRFAIPDAHAATIRTSRQVQHFVLEIFISGAPQPIHGLAIQQPRLVGFIHNRKDNVMMGRIILNCLRGREPILDQIPGFRVVDPAVFLTTAFVGPMRYLLLTE